MVAKEGDPTGIDNIEILANNGYDYAELPLAEMCELTEAEFSSLSERLGKSGVRCETCNNFFPKDIRLTGGNVSDAEVDAYVKKALERACSLGVKNIVFGSGGAKNVPEGFSLKAGYEQVVSMLKRIAPRAAEHGATIVIEPLRKQECNLINTFEEGCALARDVDSPYVRVLVDFYHFTVEKEPVEHILKYGREFLRHVHFANPSGRVYPSDPNETDYSAFIDAIKAVGYDERISCEAYSGDFAKDSKRALGFFKKQF